MPYQDPSMRRYNSALLETRTTRRPRYSSWTFFRFGGGPPSRGRFQDVVVVDLEPVADPAAAEALAAQGRGPFPGSPGVPRSPRTCPVHFPWAYRPGGIWHSVVERR